LPADVGLQFPFADLHGKQQPVKILKLGLTESLSTRGGLDDSTVLFKVWFPRLQPLIPS
jgi:hypothetical protein